MMLQMLQLETTGQFRKDFKRIKEEVIEWCRKKKTVIPIGPAATVAEKNNYEKEWVFHRFQKISVKEKEIYEKEI